jgi:hypothetical protein
MVDAMTGFNSKRDAAADKLRDGKCKLCVDGCIACDARAQPAQEPVAFDLFLESQDFYELMQTYRHYPIDAHIPFEAVKDALRAVHIKAALAQPAQEPVAYVTGMSFGRFIVEPINSAMILPIGMALYSAPQGKT